MEKKDDGLMTNVEEIIISDTSYPENKQEENESVDLKQKQKARSFLRQRFLKIISHLAGKPCELSMYDDTNVKGTFCGSDNDFTHLNIKNLETPFGVMPNVLIRSTDLIVMKLIDKMDNNDSVKA